MIFRQNVESLFSDKGQLRAKSQLPRSRLHISSTLTEVLRLKELLLFFDEGE